MFGSSHKYSCYTSCQEMSLLLECTVIYLIRCTQASTFVSNVIHICNEICNVCCILLCRARQNAQLPCCFSCSALLPNMKIFRISHNHHTCCSFLCLLNHLNSVAFLYLYKNKRKKYFTNLYCLNNVFVIICFAF